MLHLTIVILTVFTMYSDAFLNETIHIRVKRGKYYSNPPQRFYRRPPISHPTKGAFSYTPPPGYMMDDEDTYPGRPKVTSNNKYGAPSPISSTSSSSLNVPLEPAPPASAAKDQSDAHLKAIKIWTHRSKGTAYTLHTDGTLSLERPGRPKTKYGP